jgi:2-succinyl-5-enolpyruvyl-6-hydroxy-3-cyclohexene-1-carboxylate synthase
MPTCPVAITASRPRSVVNTGANQTADQDQLFGRHVRAVSDCLDEILDHRTWRFGGQDRDRGCGGPGPGCPGRPQLNVEFSEPLMPAEFAAASGSGACDHSDRNCV